MSRRGAAGFAEAGRWGSTRRVPGDEDAVDEVLLAPYETREAPFRLEAAAAVEREGTRVVGEDDGLRAREARRPEGARDDSV